MAGAGVCRYDWLGIHEEMLRDRVRVEAYKAAILGNAAAFAGKRVLDVGCGTGILSVFAARAGAAAVYAVDAEGCCAEMTRKVAEANGLGHVIQVFAGRMEDVELPSKVDVIVSEWMGYFLLYENMLEAVLAAKGRFLEEGGSIFPTVVELYVAPFTDAAMHGERRRFWSDVSGVDMSALLPEVLVEFAAEPRIEGLDFEQLVGEPILLWRHDFRGPAPAASPLRIQARASWFCPPGATAHGYAGWFDCHFDASAPAPPCERASAAEGAALAELLASAFHARFERGAAEPGEPAASKRRRSGQPPPGRPGASQASVLSTAPGAARTHWHHTLFFFREPVPPGSAVEAEFAVDVDAGAKGWVALRVQHQLGAPAGARRQAQEWLLRSYAGEGLRAPPLPTARTWLYDLRR